MYPSAAEPWFGSFVHDQVLGLREIGVHVDVVDFDGRTHRRAYLSAIAQINAHVRRRRYDLIHAHYGLTGALTLLQRRLPVVTTFHGSDVFDRWQRPVSWAVARATFPIFVSRAAAANLKLQNAVVLPSAVDTRRFVPQSRSAARSALGWPLEGYLVLFPGSRTNPVKHAELFDSAIAIAQSELPALRGVSLEGYSRDDVVHVMNAVNATLLTSRWEGSPVSIKESLACQTPVVAVPVGDIRDVLEGLPGCSVTEPHPASLAHAVLAAVKDPGSTRLRERALQYSTTEIAADLARLYRKALGGRAEWRNRS